MPKRMLDGEALWGSQKLASVTPQWARAEYANLLPLALGNGVFEATSRRIWSMVYSFNRPDVTERMVAQMLDAFSDAGMLFRWSADGRPWGFWVGIDKRGRLPKESERDRHVCGPEPPQSELRSYIATHSRSDRSGIGLDRIGLDKCANAHLSADADESEVPDVPGVSESQPESRDEQDEHSDEQGPDQPTSSRNAAPKPSPESRRSTPRAAERLLEIWQENCGLLAKVREFSPERKRKALLRLRSHRKDPQQFLEDFRAAVAKAASTPFLCGQGNTGWSASFDWFLANDTNYVKVLEGKYDGTRSRASKNLEAAANYLRRVGGQVDGSPGQLPVVQRR